MLIRGTSIQFILTKNINTCNTTTIDYYTVRVNNIFIRFFLYFLSSIKSYNHRHRDIASLSLKHLARLRISP